MAKNDYFVIVCKILCYLYDRLKNGKPIDINYLSHTGRQFQITESYWNYIIVNMKKDGLIDNVTVVSIDGQKPYAVVDEMIEITPRGIAFLQENSMMKKAINILRQHHTIVAHALLESVSVMLHKNSLTCVSKPTKFLYNLTKNLTAQSVHLNCAVLP